MEQTIGPDRGRKLHAHMRERVGIPVPLRFARNWMQWRVDDLGQLTEEQAEALVVEGHKKAAQARRQIADERAREGERRQRAAEKKRKATEAAGWYA